jgi:isochorismate synthase EntC
MMSVLLNLLQQRKNNMKNQIVIDYLAEELKKSEPVIDYLAERLKREEAKQQQRTGLKAMGKAAGR